MNDLIADTISRIKVALISRQTTVTVVKSNFVVGFLKCLLKQHYISGFTFSDNNKYNIVISHINHVILLFYKCNTLFKCTLIPDPKGGAFIENWLYYTIKILYLPHKTTGDII